MLPRSVFPLVLAFFVCYVTAQENENKCTDWNDCLTSEFCINNKCVLKAPDVNGTSCKDGSECLTNEYCVEHKCTRTAPPDTLGMYCKENKECLTGELCKKNKCVLENSREGQTRYARHFSWGLCKCPSPREICIWPKPRTCIGRSVR